MHMISRTSIQCNYQEEQMLLKKGKTKLHQSPPNRPHGNTTYDHRSNRCATGATTTNVRYVLYNDCPSERVIATLIYIPPGSEDTKRLPVATSTSYLYPLVSGAPSCLISRKDKLQLPTLRGTRYVVKDNPNRRSHNQTSKILLQSQSPPGYHHSQTRFILGWGIKIVFLIEVGDSISISARTHSISYLCVCVSF